MTTAKLLNQFDREVECDYRGERYLVRDNGAVFRLARIGTRRRPLDETWTFGTPSPSRGYLTIASEAVHRIIATAYLGVQPSDQHMVDHIDTNRHNNRPENLRWVTRLENILLNPITLRRIILAYGSLEDFFADPSALKYTQLDRNFEWMRTVSKAEAATSRERLFAWAQSNQISRGGELGEWIFGSIHSPDEKSAEIEAEEPVTVALTPSAIQRNWRTPCEFPQCPGQTGNNGLPGYLGRLISGAIFSKNKWAEAIVAEASLNDDGTALGVLSDMGPDSIKQWAVTHIYIEDEKFCHLGQGSFFSREGAQKAFYEILGVEHDIGETIDDFC